MSKTCALPDPRHAAISDQPTGLDPAAKWRIQTKWPRYEEREISAVANVLTTGRVNALLHGEQTQAFEQEFADFCGARFGIAVANGTLALELALRALGVGAGDEVIVPARSFFATAACVVAVGACPVFADIDPTSQNIDPASVEQLVNSRTRALICVHLGGWPCAMNELQALVRKHKLWLIEDCAQAHGATYEGRRVGSFGDAAAFSFCTDKIISTGGEGGMLLLNEPKLHARAWAYKDHGKNPAKLRTSGPAGAFRYLHDTFGSNYRLTEMQSAIGRIQLAGLPRWLERRRANAASLIRQLRHMPSIRLPEVPSGIEHAFYKFNLLIGADQDDRSTFQAGIIQDLIGRGVPASAGTCPDMSKEHAFTARGFKNPVKLAGAAFVGIRNVTLPVDHTLDEEDMTFMANAIRSCLLASSGPVEIIQ